MDMETMEKRLSARLSDLSVEKPPEDLRPTLLREEAYVKDFCGVSEPGRELDEELLAVCVELAAADILREQAGPRYADESVTSLRMGDVSIGYADGQAAFAAELAEKLYRAAIAVLAGRRRIRW